MTSPPLRSAISLGTSLGFPHRAKIGHRAIRFPPACGTLTEKTLAGHVSTLCRSTGVAATLATAVSEFTGARNFPVGGRSIRRTGSPRALGPASAQYAGTGQRDTEDVAAPGHTGAAAGSGGRLAACGDAGAETAADARPWPEPGFAAAGRPPGRARKSTIGDVRGEAAKKSAGRAVRKPRAPQDVPFPGVAEHVRAVTILPRESSPEERRGLRPAAAPAGIHPGRKSGAREGAPGGSASSAFASGRGEKRDIGTARAASDGARKIRRREKRRTADDR
jgi:hypothetical protein